MENWILRVDNNLNNFEAAQKEWLKYHVFIKIVRSMPEALKLLTKMDFLLVVIIADDIDYLPHLKLMRDMKPMPILVLSSKYNASEKLEAIQLGADEYLPYVNATNLRLPTAWHIMFLSTVGCLRLPSKGGTDYGSRTPTREKRLVLHRSQLQRQRRQAKD